jgi:Rod binding domain-containing protein
VSSSPEALSGAQPVVNQALEPAWVRHGSAAVQKEYAIGQEFEQMLVQQLARSLTETTGAGGEGSGEEGEGAQAGGSVLSSMLPQALASGVANDGGLGLAAELTRQLQGVAGKQSVAASTAPQSTSAPIGAGGGVEVEPTGGSES